MQAIKPSHRILALSGILAISFAVPNLQAVSPYTFTYGEQHYAGRVPTPAMQYFGAAPAQTRPQRRLRERMPAPQPLQLRGTKPFESLRRPPTLSPYLNLDARENELGVPNYHLFVRPLQQQREIEREHSTRLRKMQNRLRMATAQGIVSNNPSGGAPSTGHSSQFLNLGGYFSDAR